jgi:hypothetical protein
VGEGKEKAMGGECMYKNSTIKPIKNLKGGGTVERWLIKSNTDREQKHRHFSVFLGFN